MKLTCAGTKKSPTYYIQKTIRIGNKTTTKTVERLGNIEEIKARCGDQDPIEWAKEYAKNLLSVSSVVAFTPSNEKSLYYFNEYPESQ